MLFSDTNGRKLKPRVRNHRIAIYPGENHSLNHFDFCARGETAVVPEGDFVQFDLSAMPLQAHGRMHGEQVVARGDGNVVVVDGHGCCVHGEGARQVVGFNGDPPDPLVAASM